MISQEEILQAYEEIKYKNINKLGGLVEKELARYEKEKTTELSKGYYKITTSAVSYEIAPLQSIADKADKSSNDEKEKIKRVCEDEIMKPETSAKIVQMVKENPNVLKNSLEIVQLVAPAVAQVVGGIPALAIVGTILILIKQGILNRMLVG